jgi:HAD superfamily hydrolase (TIGR01549 family)
VPYTWLLFDADRTLFDYDRAEGTALEHAFGQLGVAFEPACLDLYREINMRVWRQFENGQITAEQLRLRRFELLFEALSQPLAPAEFSRIYLRHLARGSHLIDGASEVVPALCAKYRLALITNGLRDVQRPRLAGSAIRDCFAEVIISEEIGAAKPDPAIFDAAFAAARPPAAHRGAPSGRQPHVRHRGRPPLRPGHLLVQPHRCRAPGRRDLDLRDPPPERARQNAAVGRSFSIGARSGALTSSGLRHMIRAP